MSTTTTVKHPSGTHQIDREARRPGLDALARGLRRKHPDKSDKEIMAMAKDLWSRSKAKEAL